MSFTKLFRRKSTKGDSKASTTRSRNPFRSGDHLSPVSGEDVLPPPPYSGPSPRDDKEPAGPGLMRQPTFRDQPATDPYLPLSRFDTVFLIDDSGSMAGANWTQTAAALSTIVPICTRYDSDGVDIYFLNSPITGTRVTSSNQVLSLFNAVRPWGATPTGKKLSEILERYMTAFRSNRKVKPLNIICITDGEPSDPARLEKTIVKCARELDAMDAKERQIGVQFFQVGCDEAATESLEELDNALVEEWGVRDMVDTVSWRVMLGMGGGDAGGGAQGGLTGEGVLKCVMGAVDGGLDRKRKVR